MSKSTNGLRRSGLAAVATTSLVMGAIFAGAGVANADADFEFTRVNGQTRYDVSANAAGLYGKADHVILASGESGKFGDALTANFLAGSLGAPVLLTQLDETPAAVKKAIEDAGATKITIVGGELSVSKEQEAALAEDYTVNRIAGRTRYDVAADIIDEGTEKSDIAIVATGEKFADALAGGPVAYAAGMPLAITARDEMPAAVLQALKDANITKAVVLGGDLSVSQEVRDQLREAGITLVEEFKGADRAQVATMVADYAIKNHGFTNTRVNAATGREFSEGADALSAGPVSGKEKRAILVTAGDPSVGTERAVGEHLINWLEANAKTLTGKDNHLFGGPLSITDAMKDRMETAAQQVTSNQDYTVTGSEAATNVASASNSNSGAREYSVSGLTAGTTYDIRLFPAENVKVDNNGVVSFVDAGGANNAGDSQADRGTVDARIEQVNGSGVVPTVATEATAKSDGTITFLVDSTVAESIIPAVWLDEFDGADANTDADDNDQLDLDANDQPVEAFAIGGQKTWTPVEAADEAPDGDEGIKSVDKANNSFVAEDVTGPGTGERTYYYAAEDTFYIDLNGDSDFADAGEQVSQAEFERNLSTGDVLDELTVYYNQNDGSAAAGSNGPSTFYLNDATPDSPTLVDASATSPSTVDVTWDGTGAEEYRVYRSATPAGTFPTGYTEIATVTATDADVDYKVTDSGLEAGKTYSYTVTAVTDGDEDEPADFDEATTPQSVATISNAELTYDEVQTGRADDGDQWTLNFTENVEFAAGETPTFDLTDNDGDVIRVTCYADEAAAGAQTELGITEAVCELRDADTTDGVAGETDEMVVTLLENAEDRNAGGNGAVTYPLTITALSGLNDAGDDIAVNLANSGDKVVDDEGNVSDTPETVPAGGGV